MTDRWAAVDEYICDLLVPHDDALDAARESGVPRHEVTPNQGRLLYLLARIQGAASVLTARTGACGACAVSSSGWRRSRG